MKTLRNIMLSAGLLSGLFATLPALASPPDWAPAHGYRAKQAQHYDYVYYPQQQVYYAPSNGTWFWINGGNWQLGANLPARYQDYRYTQGVPVVLNSPRPYVQHVYVEQRYGRPWREKHHHKRHKHDRHEKHDRYDKHDRYERHDRDDRHKHGRRHHRDDD